MIDSSGRSVISKHLHHREMHLREQDRDTEFKHSVQAMTILWRKDKDAVAAVPVTSTGNVLPHV